MHKRLVNYFTLELSLCPCGPILIKSGQEGADPSKPAMEFVETLYKQDQSIYLPGSSLKGALRAQAERIVRTVGSDRRPENPAKLWAADPLKLEEYEYLDQQEKDKKKKKEGAEIYKLSSFTDQIFGSIAIASRFRIEDAYPEDMEALKIEERNGVAIDRVFGSVANGPFNYEVCTAGSFKTKLHLKNFSLAQLGLIALVLRDLNDGWFGIGFAKSRGLGQVEVQVEKATIQYPSCVLEGDEIRLMGRNFNPPNCSILGAGEFLGAEAEGYGYPQPDHQRTSVEAAPMPFNFGVQQVWQGNAIYHDLFPQVVQSWSQIVEVAA
ncbi:RAMP superfamily CRISPR-associated protein [Lyngbya confervoides]|uniref:RAMP superfamily CRISPR-associated protein n=1 Tax=Lyngbya confervoides BDU141951 TaxID=1574623 RepID=A0ABD4T600_9CYAN|nr:RAMP superfamily CRISPR-associated protein [Lyngbya confervoides]MCM1984014.1 RAMP superfamily CRISPR-associated protein [Lyngbya confervoides BDU141951]